MILTKFHCHYVIKCPDVIISLFHAQKLYWNDQTTESGIMDPAKIYGAGSNQWMLIKYMGGRIRYYGS